MSSELPSLDSLVNLAESGSVLPAKLPSAEECDALLDRRDAGSFDRQWKNAFNAVSFAAVTPTERQLIERIAKAVFVRVSNGTNQHELASYVADDFELIAAAIAGHTRHPFIEQLWRDYAMRRIPS